MKASLALLTLIVISTAKEGFALADFVDPPSGSTIARFEGAMNAVTLTCNVTLSDGLTQTFTEWFVQNLGGDDGLQIINDINFFPEIFSVGGDPLPTDPTRTFRNQLTLLNFTAELDGITIFCGTGGSGNQQQANFYLRVYRPPMLRDNVVLKVRENGGRIPVNISEGLAAFPEPTSQWRKDGQRLDGSRPELTYSTVTFDNVRRSDAGNYTVAATNFELDSSTEQVGNDTGSFYLDVLFGPILTPGPLRRYVLLNDSLSLVCGTGLESNPQASVTWMAPDGTTIMDNARYDLENGPQFVRLNFTHTISSDSGIWKCQILVESEQYVVSDGQLVRQDPSPIGQTMVDIELAVIAPPGPPLSLNVDSSAATSFVLCWEAPLEFNSPISFYTVSARNLNSTGGGNDVVTRNTTNNSTLFTVPDLLPGTTYELTVVAVSQGGDVFAVGEPSGPMTGTTDVTAPALMCNPPLSSNGIITVSWYYIHRGGLDINGLSVSYTYEEGSVTTAPVDVSVPSFDATSASVSGLVAGNDYTFTVTASNANGSTSIQCGPTSHDVGVPAQPSFGEVRTGDNAGEVVLQIKTIASGVNSPNQQFRFIIVPDLEGERLDPIERSVPDYQSGTLETIVVGSLMFGESYTFSATVANTFGTSTEANSPSVVAAGPRPPTPPPPSQASNNISAAVGGAVGGIIAVILIVAIVVVIVIVLLVYCRGKDYHPNKKESDVRYQPAPTSDSTTQVKEVTIDIGEDMPKEDTELHYADLDTFRPPSSQQKNGGAKESKPVEPEEPVEYAVITTFKKKEEAAPAVIETSAVPGPTPDTTASGEGDADKTGTATTLV